MRHFVDTEYIWRPDKGHIQPVSIALVSEDGREFYAISTAFNARHADRWVKDNVLARLPDRHPSPPPYGSPREWREALRWMAPDKIADGIRSFVGDDTPEFWGDYAAFDYVVLSMLMGGFSDWPEGWPMHVNDLQQEGIPSSESALPHHALADARAVRDAWNHAFSGERPATDNLTDSP